MSGYSLPTRAKGSGAETELRLLRKPFSRAGLLQAVSEALHS
jgi:hypothetical protein